MASSSLACNYNKQEGNHVTYYYRTSDPAKLQVVADYETEVAELRRKGSELAASLGKAVKPIYSYDIHGVSVHGVTFEDSDLYVGTLLDKALWTVPMSSSNYSRHPRARVPAAYKELSARLVQLWAEKMPRDSVKRIGLYNLLGVVWGDFLFGGSFSYFVLDGTLYVASGPADASGDMEEILTSTFLNAQKAAKEAANAAHKH